MKKEFDYKKYLIENKLTENAKMIAEYENREATPEAVITYVKLMKSKFGAKLGKFIEDHLYDEANMAYDLPKEWNDKEFAKFAKQDLELLADMDGVDVIDADFAKQAVAQALETMNENNMDFNDGMNRERESSPSDWEKKYDADQREKHQAAEKYMASRAGRLLASELEGIASKPFDYDEVLELLQDLNPTNAQFYAVANKLGLLPYNEGGGIGLDHENYQDQGAMFNNYGGWGKG